MLRLAAILVLWASAAFADDTSAAQRAFIIANMAQQLGQAELKADGLQTALIQAQKEVEDWKAAFGAWCGTAPNCGRPDK
jgi:hypothetical protein